MPEMLQETKREPVGNQPEQQETSGKQQETSGKQQETSGKQQEMSGKPARN